MMTTEKKKEIIAAYGRTPDDTGSPEVQVALLTAYQHFDRALERE